MTQDSMTIWTYRTIFSSNYDKAKERLIKKYSHELTKELAHLIGESSIKSDDFSNWIRSEKFISSKK